MSMLDLSEVWKELIRYAKENGKLEATLSSLQHENEWLKKRIKQLEENSQK